MSISIEPKIEESCPPIRNVVNTQQSQKRRSEFNFIFETFIANDLHIERSLRYVFYVMIPASVAYVTTASLALNAHNLSKVAHLQLQFYAILFY